MTEAEKDLAYWQARLERHQKLNAPAELLAWEKQALDKLMNNQ